jgi:hypothetical protein
MRFAAEPITCRLTRGTSPEGVSMTRRTFLITGASKGIGRAVAEHLDRSGHRVVGIARTPDLSFPGILFPLDLSDRTLTQEVLAELARTYEFDGLVNNVGLVRPQVLGEIDLDTFDDVMRVNLHSALQATQTLLPQMRAKGWGRVVNISSLTVLGITQRTAYGVRGGESGADQLHPLLGAGTGANRDHGQRRGARPDGHRTVPRQQPDWQRRRSALPGRGADGTAGAAGRNCRSDCVSTVRTKRLYHWANAVCGRWLLDR